MQNDLIVFEFQNDDGSEVLLAPETVGQLAEILTQGLSHALYQTVRESGEDPGQPRVWLAGAPKGSVKLAFRVLFHRNSSLDRKAALEETKLAAEIWAIVMGTLVAAGSTLGALYVWMTADDTPAAITIAKDDAENYRHIFDEMLGLAYASEVDRVLIMIPDQPTVMLAIDPNMHAKALGAGGPIIDPALLNREIGGALLVMQPQIKARLPGNQDAELMFGRFTVDGKYIPVLFRWNSRRERPKPNETVEIRGRLATIASAGILPLKPITDEIRPASAFLDVYKQVVAE
jgi:hypothetical protein